MTGTLLGTMNNQRPTIERMRFVCFILLTFLCRNNSDCLIINPVSVPTSPPELQIKLSSGAPGNVNFNRAASNGARYSTGTHFQWSGVLLLSLLQQQDSADGTLPLNESKQLPLSTTISSTSITTADSSEGIQSKLKNAKGLETDKVERVLDANTIQLKKKGVVKLAGVRMPSSNNSNFQFPACFSYSPSYKIRQLVPKNTMVRIQTVGGGSSSSSNKNNIPQVVLIRNDDSLVVNEELVKTGFAVVKTGFSKQQSSLSPSSQAILDADSLTALQESARSQGLGIFSKCDDTDTGGDGGITTSSFVAEFEPLERSMETVYLSDGGKRQLKDETKIIRYSSENPPKNPGDTKGCSDFETYEDALQWYEAYKPYYGDIAKLDRDGDGVPCPGLPHTSNQNRYRMKVPTASLGSK